jgi:hypothetical protein
MKPRSMPGDQWPSKSKINKEKYILHLKLVHGVIVTKKNHISMCNVENFHKAVRVRKQGNSFYSQISDQCRKSNFSSRLHTIRPEMFRSLVTLDHFR